MAPLISSSANTDNNGQYVFNGLRPAIYSVKVEAAFFASLKGGDTVQIEASPQVATSIARTSDDSMVCYFANFAGLRGGVNPIQTPQQHVRITVPSSAHGKGSSCHSWGDRSLFPALHVSATPCSTFLPSPKEASSGTDPE